MDFIKLDSTKKTETISKSKNDLNGFNCFVQNLQCKAFPCHKVEDKSQFNCKFCYCPLYFVDDCGGDFTTINHNGREVKDCTNCLLPHTLNARDKMDEAINKQLSNLYK